MGDGIPIHDKVSDFLNNFGDVLFTGQGAVELGNDGNDFLRTGHGAKHRHRYFIKQNELISQI